MSLLFSNKNEYKPKYKLDVLNENYNLDDYIFDLNIISESMYMDIMEENMTILHYGSIYNNSEIMMESLQGLTNAIKNFFKWLADKLSQLLNKMKQLYHRFTMSTTQYISNYKNDIFNKDWEEFNIMGYEFTFSNNIPSLEPVNELVSMYNDRVEKDLSDIEDNRFEFNTFREELMGNNNMDTIRGKILGTKPIESKDFEAICERIYRNWNNEPKNITVNKSLVDDILKNHKRIEEEQKKITVEFSNLDSALKQLSKYFESAKIVEYQKDEKKIRVNKVSIAGNKFSKDPNKITANYSAEILERVNKYYTILFYYAKAICNATSTAVSKKAIALKDNMKQNDTILKAVLKSDYPEKIKNMEKEGKSNGNN